MKKRLLIPLVVFMVIAGVGTAVTYMPRSVPWDECSEVYRHYADSPDVSAAYLKDYRVNDTLTLSATVLQAVNDTGWGLLLQDFNISYFHNDSVALEKGNDVLRLELGVKFSKEIMSDEDLAVLSLRDRYACVFHNLKESEIDYCIDAIMRKAFRDITNDRIFKNDESVK